MRSVIVPLFVLLAVASCSKSDALKDEELAGHFMQYGDAEASSSTDCAYFYWDCLESYGAVYDDSGIITEINEEIWACMEDHRDCMFESVDVYGANWDIVPVWTDFPDAIEFSDHSIELKFKLYDVVNEVYISSPASYVDGLALEAVGLQGDLTYDNDVFLTSSASLSGDTYTFTIDGEDLEDAHSDKFVIDFRLRLRNLSMPTITHVNTVDDYMYVHLPLVIEDNL